MFHTSAGPAGPLFNQRSRDYARQRQMTLSDMLLENRIIFFGSAGNNSDASKLVPIDRGTGGTDTTYVDNVVWLPFGPFKEYRQANTISGNKLMARLAWDLAHRPSEILYEQETSGTDLFRIAHTLDAQGRLAFYTKGEFGSGWGLTASADTREGPLDEIFTNFLDKSPQALFRRIDPDYSFPTFGDDGTVVEDAPTSGKFYLKLARKESYGLWGNFKIGYDDNDLARVDRGLYGANVHYQTLPTTSFGEPRFMIDGFSAQPGTVGTRDEFLGTGGGGAGERQGNGECADRDSAERDPASGVLLHAVPPCGGLSEWENATGSNRAYWLDCKPVRDSHTLGRVDPRLPESGRIFLNDHSARP